MRASHKNKKRRQDEGQNVAKPVDQKGSSRGTWIAGGIFVAVLAVAAIFFGILNSGVLHHWTTAATVGSHKVSPAMYNFFYNAVSQQNAGSPVEMLESLTNEEMAKTYAVYDEALRNGFAMTDAQKESLEAEIASLDTYAGYFGYANGQAYLTAAYGVGCDIDRYREYLELTQIAGLYGAAHQQATAFSDEEVNNYYESHREELDTVSYRTFYLDSEEEANAFADAAAGSEAAFAEQARQHAPEGEAENYESDDATLYSDQKLNVLPAELHDWLADPARTNGETTVVQSGEEWTVAQFVDNWTKYDDGQTIDVRHILIKSDETVTAEQAKAKADEVLAAYQAGEQTEAAFGELAKQHSADGNAAQGGIYEGVTPGQMVETFNDWCFDPARQPGDTGVVETEYGAHVMYFVGQGKSPLYNEALGALRTQELESWTNALGASMTVTTGGFGMSLTNKD